MNDNDDGKNKIKITFDLSHTCKREYVRPLANERRTLAVPFSLHFFQLTIRFSFHHALPTDAVCHYLETLHEPTSFTSLKCTNQLKWIMNLAHTRCSISLEKKTDNNKNGDVQMCIVIMHVLLQGNWKFVELLSTCRLCALQIWTNETYCTQKMPTWSCKEF